MCCEASQLLFSASCGFQFSSGPIYTNWYGIEFILKFGPADHLSVESSRSTVTLSCTWSEKPFLKEGSEAEEATTPLRVLSSPANSKLTTHLPSAAPLSAAWHLACFIYSSLFREAFCAFHEISPGFWLCSMGKEAKYNSKLACCENS